VPIRRQNRPRAKVLRANDSQPQEPRSRRPRDVDPIETIDWLAWWTLSIAASAILIAALGYFANDPVGAAMVLTGAAAIMAIALGVTRAPGHSQT
jgi:hypothetical protein